MFSIYLCGYWHCRMAFKVQRLFRFLIQTVKKSLLYQNQGTLKRQQNDTLHKSHGSQEVSPTESCLVISPSRSAVLLSTCGGFFTLRYGMCSAHGPPGSRSWHFFPQRSYFSVGTPDLRWSSNQEKEKERNQRQKDFRTT